MSRLTIQTPSRLHFGLLAWGPRSPRQFGGVGLMVDDPGLVITAVPANDWQSDGPLASRALEAARRVSDRLGSIGIAVVPAHLSILQAPSEHVGLGVGTQLGLAIARLVCELAGHDATAIELAEHVGRGLRSGIGLHGFALGGLIVDGGRRGPAGVPPLLTRLEFPADWSVLVVVPPQEHGLHGPSEIKAFADLPPFPEVLVDRLCRLVLLGLLPAVVEQDLEGFGDSLEELQARVGQGFAPVQGGGTFARPQLEAIVTWLRAEGLKGVGQSSWGPTLYGFTDAPTDFKAPLLAALRERFALPPGSARWTSASRLGAAMNFGEKVR